MQIIPRAVGKNLISENFATQPRKHPGNLKKRCSVVGVPVEFHNYEVSKFHYYARAEVERESRWETAARFVNKPRVARQTLIYDFVREASRKYFVGVYIKL